MPEPGDLAGYQDRYYRAQFVSRLQVEFPEPCSHLTQQALQDLVCEGWEDALALEIAEPEDIYRFLKLYFLPEQLLRSSFFCAALRRILNNISVSGTGRMNLIDRVLQGRVPASASIVNPVLGP